MTVHYRQQGTHLIVFGNTFQVKDQLKALGGRFNGTDKNWRIPFSDQALEAISGLCRVMGGGQLGGHADLVTTVPVPTETAVILHKDPDAPRPEDGLTIRQLMERAGLALTSAFPEPVWVIGEIQSLSIKPSGVFLELAEARDGGHMSSTVTVRAIIWSSSIADIRSRRGDLSEVLQDGLKIRCLCRVQLYRDRGQISLAIEDLDPSYTKGALALAREKLLRELRAKGLDQAQKRLTVTPFPFRIGLVSSEGSRAKSDFLDQLSVFGFPGAIIFAHAAMQGEAVPFQVVRAINALEAHGVDLIVVTRGGGSAADLRWFDAPEIAYAIAGASIPIVAAIGHHEDVAVAEEICFLRQKTPTAAADFVIGLFRATRERVDGLGALLAELLGRRIEEFGLAMATWVERLGGAADRSFSGRQERVMSFGHALVLSAERAISARERQLGEHERALAVRDPQPWLLKGWTQLSGAKGPVRSIEQLAQGDVLHVRLADGRATVTVTDKTPLPRVHMIDQSPACAGREET